jgi:hypothetical protein
MVGSLRLRFPAGLGLRALAPKVARWALLLWGLRFLELLALDAFGGKQRLWLFQKLDAHRFTAMAMMLGKLRLSSALSKLDYDQEIFNGAVYTHWGFGVPLMQLPFHALWRWRHAGVFPDRAIYFLYFGLLVPVLWAAFDRLFAMREGPGALTIRRHALSFSVTALVLVCGFFPLMSCRFIIYEETIAYFMVAELAALAAYVFALRRWSDVAIYWIGFAAGLGLLIRPTGLIFVGVWATLMLLERPKRRALVVFAGAIAPFVVFWAWSNWVRSGSIVATGLSNSVPWNDFHTPMLRFGSYCGDTPAHTARVVQRMLEGFFVTTGGEQGKWLDTCHFGFETRPGSPPNEPFFGIGVLVFLGWTFLHQLARRERRLALYAGHATVVVLFGAYLWAGAGLAWRYFGDFWPALALAGVQYVRFLRPAPTSPLLGFPTALALCACSYSVYGREIEPSIPTIVTGDASRVPKLWTELTASLEARDEALPSRLECGKVPSWPIHDGQGWASNCTVSTFTNFYVGVPQKGDDHFQLRFTTSGMSAETVQVYVNGLNYVARRNGDEYEADVTIPTRRLVSPIVMATVEWVHGADAPAGKLLSIELV